MATAAPVAGVVLAAGASSRLGQSKQLLNYAGETLLARTVAAVSVAVETVYVVTGADREAVWSTTSAELAVEVFNAEWHGGMGTSLAAGIAALPPGVAAVLIAVCDQPLVESNHYLALTRKWRAHPHCCIASAYGGTLGVPAVLPRGRFGDALRLSGDQGARALLRDASAATLAIPCSGGDVDIDTAQDVHRLERLTAQQRSSR